MEPTKLTAAQLKLNQEIVQNTPIDIDDDGGYNVTDLVDMLEKLTGLYFFINKKKEDDIGVIYGDELHEHISALVRGISQWADGSIAKSFYESYKFSDNTRKIIEENFPILNDFKCPSGNPKRWMTMFEEQTYWVCKELSVNIINYYEISEDLNDVRTALRLTPALTKHFHCKSYHGSIEKLYCQTKIDKALCDGDLTEYFKAKIDKALCDGDPTEYFKAYLYITKYLKDDKKRWLKFFEELNTINRMVLKHFNTYLIKSDPVVEKQPVKVNKPYTHPGNPDEWMQIFEENINLICNAMVESDIKYFKTSDSFLELDSVLSSTGDLHVAYSMIELGSRLSLLFRQPLGCEDKVPPKLSVTKIDKCHDKPNSYFRAYLYVTEYLKENEKRWLTFFEMLNEANCVAMDCFSSAYTDK